MRDRDMRLVLSTLVLFTFCSTALAQEISDTEAMIYVGLSYISMFIPAVVLIFLAVRKGAATGTKFMWGTIFLVLWFVLGQADIFYLLFAPTRLAIYLQFIVEAAISAFFVFMMYRFTKPKFEESEHTV